MKPRKQGDTGYAIEATLMAGASPRDLTGSSVALFTRDARTKVIKINGSAVTIVTPAAGTVSYLPLATDVDTPGEYDVEFRETTAGGNTIHYPSDGYERLQIVEKIG